MILKFIVDHNHNKENLVFFVVLWIISVIFLLPWLYIQSQTSINSDVAWLSVCAQRILEGQTLSQGCYDTNPPLSILLYTPFVLLNGIFSIELHDTLFWGTFFLVLLFTVFTYKILKYIPPFDSTERFIITLSFLCALTIIPTLSFAQREHFIAMTLLPFILVQLCITYHYRIPYFLKYSVIIASALVLLIKPHFGLVPAFLFIHRMMTQKRFFSVIKYPDFIILSVFCIAYLCAVFFFFSDFVEIILPDILRLYLPYNNVLLTLSYLKLYGFWTYLCLCLSFFIPALEKQRFIFPIAFCATLCLSVFAIQMKGFSNHLLPFYALFFPLGFYLFYHFLISKTGTKRAYILPLCSVLLVFMIFTASYIFSPLKPDYTTHKMYQSNKITEYINAHCRKPCSYFMTYENMDIMNQLAFYSDDLHASRFPSFWFQPAIDGLVPFSEIDGRETREDIKHRFTDYIAEDIKHMSPSLLFILHKGKNDNVDTAPDEFIEYFSISPKFRDILSEYKKIDRLIVDRSYFYQDTKYDYTHLLTWDVYKKDAE